MSEWIYRWSPRSRPLLAILPPAAVVLLACGGSSAVNSGTSVGSSSTVGSTSSAPQHFKVGDQVKVGDAFVVTVNSFKTSAGDQFDQPKAGDEYVVVDVTVKNVSAQEQDISSALNFTFNDSTGQKYDETFAGSGTPPDGKVELASQLRGQLTYEVPASQHSFNLAFQADVVSGGETIWTLSA